MADEEGRRYGPEIIQTIAWRGVRRLSDGRTFVTDGRILLDVKYWTPFFPDDVLPEKADPVPAEKIKRLLKAKAGDLVVMLDDLVKDRKGDCFQVPGQGIRLGKSYIYFLMALRASSGFRLHCDDESNPVFIHDGRKRIGAIMPMREKPRLAKGSQRRMACEER